jgi:hypothetical protein
MRMRMMMRLAVVLIVIGTSTAIGAPAATVKVPGTYSSLEYNDEGGDLLGMEVKIVPAGGRLQAAVLVSEGEPAPMVVVDVRVTGRTVSFKMPASDFNEAWNFNATVTRKGLVGTIAYASGAKENVTLARRCGYWDR